MRLPAVTASPHRRHESPEQRAERVRQVRQAIARGTYETPEKLAVAVERLWFGICDSSVAEDTTPPGGEFESDDKRRYPS